MGLKEIVKRLEQMANSTKELCPHLPPLIEHADGTTENASTHDCGLPRLRIVAGYTDDSDERMRRAAHDTFAKIRARFDIEPEQCAEIVAEQFHIPARELLERAA
jgi:hypothetical protein